MSRVTAVILAGGRLGAPDGTNCLTARLPIGDRPLVDIVVSAVTGTVSRVLIPGEAIGGCPARVSRIPPGGNPVEHLAHTLGYLDDSTSHLLICPVDQPFIGHRDVAEFLRVALRHDVDFVYSHAKVAECEAQYPGMKRTGIFGLTGGNLMLFRVDKLPSILDSALRVYRVRKHPLDAVLRSVTAIVRHRISFRSVLCPPALAADIDRWQHYLDVCRLLGYPPLTTLAGVDQRTYFD